MLQKYHNSNLTHQNSFIAIFIVVDLINRRDGGAKWWHVWCLRDEWSPRARPHTSIPKNPACKLCSLLRKKILNFNLVKHPALHMRRPTGGNCFRGLHGIPPRGHLCGFMLLPNANNVLCKYVLIDGANNVGPRPKVRWSAVFGWAFNMFV